MALSLSPARYWREISRRYRLVASMCRSCGRRYYPPKGVCPKCGSRNLVNVELPKTGILLTYTVIYTVPSGFREHAPLIVGLVELDDGTRVLSSLTDVTPDEVKVGMRLEAVLRRVQEGGESGIICYAIKFRPQLRHQRKPT